MKLNDFIKEEKKGVGEYQKAEKTDKKAKPVYKKIVPEEKKHIKMLKLAKKMGK